MTERRYRGILAALAALGLAVRLLWARAASREPQGLVDPARYLHYARAIADGKGMVEWTGNPTAYYPPGYPWFAGIVTWLSQPFTDSPWAAILVVQAFIAAAGCVLAACLARRLAGPVAGLVAAGVFALYPNLVFHSGVLLGETLFNTLFLAFLVLALRRPAAEARRPPELVAVGVVLGLAVLVRPISLAVVPVLFAIWWWARRDVRAALGATAVVVVGTAACILPWTVRNQLRMHELVPISTNTGENLCIGNSPDADGAFTLSAHCDFGNGLDSPAMEVEVDQRKTRYALGRIARDPGRQPWLVWRRFWFTWVRDGDHDGLVAVQSYNLDPWIEPDTREGLARVADVTYWVVCAAGLAGAAGLVARRRPEDLLMVGATVVIAAVPLAFFGDARFKVPVIPLLIVLAATNLRHLAPAAPAEAEPVGPGEPATTADET